VCQFEKHQAARFRSEFLCVDALWQTCGGKVSIDMVVTVRFETGVQSSTFRFCLSVRYLSLTTDWAISDEVERTRRHPADCSQQFLCIKWFVEKLISANGRTGIASLNARGIKNQDFRFREVGFYVCENSQSSFWRLDLGRQVQAEDRNGGLINGGPAHGRWQVVCGDNFVFVAERPKKLLGYSFVVINDQNSRFHLEDLQQAKLPGNSLIF